MYSQDDAVRGVYYDSGQYRTIASSSFFGAMADGINNNTKADVMAQYLSFLNGDIEPNINVQSDLLDFGITFPNILFSHELEIYNSGSEVLQISNVIYSGVGYSYYGPTEFDLEPSEQQILEIEFEIGEIGEYFGELIIYSNDPDTPELVIQLSADCVLPPVIQYDPLSIDIMLTTNQIHEEIITLSNIGGFYLSCELMIVDTSQYVGWLEVDQDSCVIQPNGFEEILLSFDPAELETGQYSAEISIIHNDPHQFELIIPITMTLNYTNAGDDLISVTNKLIGNYPNPFNPLTTISFSIDQNQQNEQAELAIYNLKGQKIRQFPIFNSQSSITWDGTDQTNKPVTSGIYFYKLKSGSFEQTKKMILLK